MRHALLALAPSRPGNYAPADGQAELQARGKSVSTETGTTALARLEQATQWLAEIAGVGVWSQLVYAERAALPKDPGVYVVFDGETVFYIGSAANLRDRWTGSSHHRTAQAIREPLAMLGFFTTGSVRQARRIEQRLITVVRPYWNGASTGAFRSSTSCYATDDAHVNQRVADYVARELGNPQSAWSQLARTIVEIESLART